jgi:hypothetical protein
MKEVFVSMVTDPDAAAAGMLGDGKGEGTAGLPEPDEEKVFTVRISVLIGKVRMLSI